MAMRLQKNPGTYALIFRTLHQRTISIGKLGKLKIRKGYYVYVGSAFGPGGIRARVKRHIRIRKKPHWHIDYMRPALELLEVWFTYDPQKREHQWAGILMGMNKLPLPLLGFGSSDCKCQAHLFFFSSPIIFKDFNGLIEFNTPNHYALDRIKGDFIEHI